MQEYESYDDTPVVRDFRERYRAVRNGPRHGPPRAEAAAIRTFRSIIYGYYRRHRRDFPWRRTDDPYQILVSEIMLQQTQTARVTEKFVEFIRAFPSIEALAGAKPARVLAVWQGMGYNRRARYLHELARMVMTEHGGVIPDDPRALAALPGIGAATAASICAFAFNKPTVFIETNIRTVFIHFFFHHTHRVNDRDIIPLVEAALDRRKPHHWYSALMDYGAMLKRRHPNPSRKSAHHQKQQPFEGSRRQLRGLVLRSLLEHPGISAGRLSKLIDRPEEAVHAVVRDLVKEKLVIVKGRRLYC